MRVLAIACFAGAVLGAAGKDKDAGPQKEFWGGLTVKREALPSLHQEFEISRSTQSANGEQESKSQLILDMGAQRWRETYVSGSGKSIRVYDGASVYAFEEDSDEYEKSKPGKKKDDDAAPIPMPYRLPELQWNKAKEVQRMPCGFPGKDHPCVLWDAPLKGWTRAGNNGGTTRLLEGAVRLLLDLETGMIVSSNLVQSIEGPRSAYQTNVRYTLRRMNYSAPADESLFRLPDNVTREVKELSEWDAKKITKVLAGKPAPELNVKDINGKPVRLADLKGKTVLLDFWTTWCPPCRADAPSLAKLYRKFGQKELEIVGISVSEERAVVEKYLREHPKEYATVLSTENDLPRPYQIGVFPTYWIVDAEGKVASVAEGDQGFGELRKMLKKAGMDVD
jgi:thiol-disulfide isomerase/thioredoxin